MRIFSGKGCKSDQFECKKTKDCISMVDRCDGAFDCGEVEIDGRMEYDDRNDCAL